MTRPDPLNRHDSRYLLLLKELDLQKNVSQRRLGERLGMAASLVNRLIGELIALGYVEVVDDHIRPFSYRLTDRGRDYRHMLDYREIRSVVGTFREVQERIRRCLRDVRKEGVSRLVLYGTGDVMEVTYPLAQALGFKIVGLVDDDPRKQGDCRRGHLVHAPSAINELQPEVVLITTFRHSDEILDKIEGSLRETISVVEL